MDGVVILSLAHLSKERYAGSLQCPTKAEHSNFVWKKCLKKFFIMRDFIAIVFFIALFL